MVGFRAAHMTIIFNLSQIVEFPYIIMRETVFLAYKYNRRPSQTIIPRHVCIPY